MSERACLLLETATGWQLELPGQASGASALEGGPCLSAEELAEQVAARIAGAGRSRSGLVLGVASTSALAATMNVPLVDQRKRRVLCYELEGHLPRAAEELVADFVAHEEEVLGVGIEIAVWLPIVMELELRGLRVQSIVPAALLALQSFCAQEASSAAGLIIWCDGSWMELYRRCGRAVSAWVHCGLDATTLAQQIAVESLRADDSRSCVVVNAPPALLDEARATLGTDYQLLQRDTKSLAEHALDSAIAIVEGAESPWIELRREELAAGDPYRKLRGSLRAMVASAALLLLAAIAATWSWTARYESQREQLRAGQEAVFRGVLPGSRVPPAVVSRLRSEQAKLAGARGSAGAVELPVPALRILHQLLVALPEQQRFRLRDVRVENGQVDLDVELRSHAAANSLVEALRDQGFEVAAPATVQRSDKVVSSRLFASLPLELLGQDRVTASRDGD